MWNGNFKQEYLYELNTTFPCNNNLSYIPYENIFFLSFYNNADELIQKLDALKKEKKEEDSDLEVAAKYKDVLTLFKVQNVQEVVTHFI